MAHLVSLVDFLNTGHFGPLRPGSSVREVVELLGPPMNWIANDTDPVPPYWIYDNLELRIDYLDGGICDWFQINNFNDMHGDAHIINSKFVLKLDGLTSKSRMHDFVGKIENIERVSVRLVDEIEYSNPIIFTDINIGINFSMDRIRHDSFKRTPDIMRSEIALLNQEAALDSIVSWKEPPNLDDPRYVESARRMHPYYISGREFLDALARG